MKAIIFDKDGTLMQFQPFWTAVAEAAIAEFALKYGAEKYAEEFKAAIGLREGKADVDGILCAGTYGQMADAFCAVLQRHGNLSPVTDEQIAQTFERNVGAGKILPVCENLPAVLEDLRRCGLLLFLATTDDPAITRLCLNGLKIYDKFERIYTDDGTHANKPDPQIIGEILNDYRLSPDEICMVGDTMTDVLFAENGNIKSFCVGEGEAKSRADYAVKDVSFLGKALGVLEK